MSTVLLTGGAGYIGAHVAARLLEGGTRVVVLDDLSNGSLDAIERAERLGSGWIEREIGDLCDPDFVHGVFNRWPFDAVVHLAAKKSVADSIADPQGTERVNAQGTRVLAEAMTRVDLRRVVHASTAAVYQSSDAPISEDGTLAPLSPYASSKLDAEAVLDAGATGLDWGVVHLRFFNVCGAHPSGQLGEPLKDATNLMPRVLRAARDGSAIEIFGDDYPTPDGTCLRDYVHVEDIVEGVLAALDHTARVPGSLVTNLGTGRGHSVLDVIAAVERAAAVPIRRRVVDRREGDPVHTVASADRAAAVLGWRSTWGLDDMAAHAWAWASEA